MNIIFLTYVNRSGSTFLANLFSGSGEVLVCPEADIIVREYLEDPLKKFNFNNETRDILRGIIQNDPKLKVWKLPINLLSELENARTNFDVFLSLLRIYRNTIKPEAFTIIFKAERVIYLFPKFARYESGDIKIKMLAIQRDCRGIYTSQKNTLVPESGNQMSKGPIETAIIWRNYIKKCKELKSFNNFYIINYEDLIRNLQYKFESLIQTLEIKKFEFSPLKGDLFERMSDKHKKIHLNILREPLLYKIDSWQRVLNDSDICLIELVIKKELLELGYSLSKIECKSIKLYLSYFIKSFYYFFNQTLEKIIFKIKRIL